MTGDNRLPFLADEIRAEHSAALDIDTTSLSVHDQLVLIHTLRLIAERECGRLLRELDYRDKHWTAESEDAFAEQVDRERETVHGELMAQLEANEVAS